MMGSSIGFFAQPLSFSVAMVDPFIVKCLSLHLYGYFPDSFPTYVHRAQKPISVELSEAVLKWLSVKGTTPHTHPGWYCVF